MTRDGHKGKADIVERLREVAKRYPFAGLLDGAADEVERLRADRDDEHDISQELAREVLDLQGEVVRLREALTAAQTEAEALRAVQLDGGPARRLLATVADIICDGDENIVIAAKRLVAAREALTAAAEENVRLRAALSAIADAREVLDGREIIGEGDNPCGGYVDAFLALDSAVRNAAAAVAAASDGEADKRE